MVTMGLGGRTEGKRERELQNMKAIIQLENHKARSIFEQPSYDFQHIFIFMMCINVHVCVYSRQYLHIYRKKKVEHQKYRIGQKIFKVSKQANYLDF